MSPINDITKFEIFGRAKNHGRKFLELSQNSFSRIVIGIVNSLRVEPVWEFSNYKCVFFRN